MKNKDLLVPAIFLLASGIFLLKGFLQNQIIWGFDTPKIIFPLISLLDESFKNFHLPLWTEYIYFGFPIGADGQIPWFYPFSILHVILSLHSTVTILSLLHIFAAGVFTYLFTRTIGLNRFSAVFAGVAFMFNGFIISHLQYYSHIYGYAYLPLILFFIELAIQRSNYTYFMLAGVMSGFQLVSGHPNIPIMSLIYVSLYCLVRTWQKKLFLFKGILIFGLIAFFVALPYLNLLAELVPLSVRASGTAGALYSSFSFFDFITFVFPNFFLISKGYWTEVPTWHFWTYWGQVETTGYVGLVTLMLLPFAFTKESFKKVRIFMALFVISLILALGKNTPIYPLLLNLPFLKGMTAPGKFLFLVDFSLAIIAAGGLHYLSKNNIRKKLRLTFIYAVIPIILFSLVKFSLYIVKINPREVYNFFVAAYSPLGYIQGIDNKDIFLTQIISSLNNQTNTGLIIVSVASLLIILMVNSFKGSFIKFGIVLLLIVDIMSFANYVNNWRNPNELFHNTDKDIIQAKQNLKDSFNRLYTFSNVWSNLMPDQMIPYHIQDGNGFVSLPLERFAKWQNIAENQWNKGNSNLFKMGSIKYVYNPAVVSALVEIADSFPRVYATNNFMTVSSEKEAFNILQSESFDPQKVIIENTDTNPLISNDALYFTPLSIFYYSNDYIKILTDDQKEGLLVLNDSFYPGWKAYINGKETKIYRTNYLFRSIYLPKGSTQVEFKYQPRFFTLTIIISLSAILLTLLLVWKKALSLQKSLNKS